MADALSEALQKLSVARTGSPLRTDYQSPAPSEPSPDLAGVIGHQECSETACDANSAVQDAYCDQASMTLEIATAQAIASECLTTLAMAPTVICAEVATSFVGSTSDSEEVSTSVLKMTPVETTHPEPNQQKPVVSIPEAVAEAESTNASSATSRSLSAELQDSGTISSASEVVTNEATATAPTVTAPTVTAFAVTATAIETVPAEERQQQPIRKSPPIQRSLPLWKRSVAAVLEHRRNAAAVVVLICMAVFWFDDPTSRNSTNDPVDTMAEDFSEVEAALSEFDVRSSPGMKEPAEPIDVPTPFDLTIPTHQTVSDHDSTSNPSEATATYPDSYGGLEVPASNGFSTTHGPAMNAQSSGVSAAPVSAPAGSGRNVRARLSHSIQPIN